MKDWDDALPGDFVISTISSEGPRTGKIFNTTGFLGKVLYIIWDDEQSSIKRVYNSLYAPILKICESEQEKLFFLLKYNENMESVTHWR